MDALKSVRKRVMPVSIMEVLTLLLVLFAALSYIDNHKKKQHPTVQSRCYFINCITEGTSDYASDLTFLSRLYNRAACFSSGSFKIIDIYENIFHFYWHLKYENSTFLFTSYTYVLLNVIGHNQKIHAVTAAVFLSNKINH